MRIGEAAGAAGLEASAIRFYEKQGVLPGPERTESGYRDYSDQDVELLRFVRRARRLEIPLDDIREIVELRHAGQAPCEVVWAAMAREASLIGERIRELQALQRELKRLLKLADEAADNRPRGDYVCHIVEAGNLPAQLGAASRGSPRGDRRS
ncbi:MAG: MerR family transcriptional regulator [Acidimicrobiia bacterium]